MLKSGKMLQDKYFSLINECIDTADSRTLCFGMIREWRQDTNVFSRFDKDSGWRKESLYECLEHILQKRDLSLRNIIGVDAYTIQSWYNR